VPQFVRQPLKDRRGNECAGGCSCRNGQFEMVADDAWRHEPVVIRHAILAAIVGIRSGIALALETAGRGLARPHTARKAVEGPDEGEHCQQRNRDANTRPHAA
jgi:hypothetical protein